MTKCDPIWVALTELSAPPCDGAFTVSLESRAHSIEIIDEYLKANPGLTRDQLWRDYKEREALLEARTPIPDIVLDDGLVLPGTETVMKIEAEQPGIFDIFRKR